MGRIVRPWQLSDKADAERSSMRKSTSHKVMKMEQRDGEIVKATYSRKSK